MVIYLNDEVVVLAVCHLAGVPVIALHVRLLIVRKHIVELSAHILNEEGASVGVVGGVVVNSERVIHHRVCALGISAFAEHVEAVGLFVAIFVEIAQSKALVHRPCVCTLAHEHCAGSIGIAYHLACTVAAVNVDVACGNARRNDAVHIHHHLIRA